MKRKSLKLIFCTLFLFQFYTYLSAQPALDDDGLFKFVNYTGDEEDFIIPLNTPYKVLQFTLRGGDGGEAVRDDCHSNGGEGATTVTRIVIGTLPGQIPSRDLACLADRCK